jgi:hypothetical protein
MMVVDPLLAMVLVVELVLVHLDKLDNLMVEAQVE